MFKERSRYVRELVLIDFDAGRPRAVGISSRKTRCRKDTQPSSMLASQRSLKSRPTVWSVDLKFGSRKIVRRG